jgi:hypothetical protein
LAASWASSDEAPVAVETSWPTSFTCSSERTCVSAPAATDSIALEISPIARLVSEEV